MPSNPKKLEDIVNEVFEMGISTETEGAGDFYDEEDTMAKTNQIINYIESILPKQVHFNDNNVPRYLKPDQGETWEGALRFEQGYNQAITEVREALESERA